jgi:hypothetical protein
MPLIFNSVTRFYEQIGRRRTHVSNPTQLDSLECIFIGPQELATGFVPLDLARHPDFPGMQCSGWDIINKEALMAEARARYSGKFAAGAGLYVGVPLITTSRHLGSVSWTTSYSTSPTQVATASYTVRYTAKGVTFKYLTNRRPTAGFDGDFVSQAQPYLGTENLQQFQTSLSFATGAPHFDASLGYGGFVSSSLSWRNDLTDLPVNDLGTGWYECSEIFLTSPYITSIVV